MFVKVFDSVCLKSAFQWKKPGYFAQPHWCKYNISGYSFLNNNCHSSVKFTMETESNGVLPFLGMQLLNRAPHIETKVYIKPTHTGQLFDFIIYFHNF